MATSFTASPITPPSQWASLYEAVLNIIGDTGIIIPLGDTQDEAANRTTVTTRRRASSGVNNVFTYSEAVTAFDTPPSYEGPARIPVVSFNGTDERAIGTDDDYWSRGDSSDDNPMSIAAWIKVTDTAASRTILSKYGGTTREWLLRIFTDDKLQFAVFDESVDRESTRKTDAAVTQGSWIHVCVTYDGTAGASALDGATLYVNGAAVASTATNDALYVAMENTTRTPGLGSTTGSGTEFKGSMAGGPLGPIFTQVALSADEVNRLYQLGRASLFLV